MSDRGPDCKSQNISFAAPSPEDPSPFRRPLKLASPITLSPEPVLVLAPLAGVLRHFRKLERIMTDVTE